MTVCTLSSRQSARDGQGIKCLKPSKTPSERQEIPEAETKLMAEVLAQYESEVVYHSIHQDWVDQGIIFTDTDSALRDYPDLF